MITYYTCWLLEQRVGDEWRVLGTIETSILPFQIVNDVNKKAKHRHPKYNRDDLYYDEESDTLYKVSETKHYIGSKTEVKENGKIKKACPL